MSCGVFFIIHIFDTYTYHRIKQIQCKDYLENYDTFSSLYPLNNGTFIYSHKGYFCQISSTTYEILFKDEVTDEFRGTFIISSSNGKYIIADNENEYISIFRANY